MGASASEEPALQPTAWLDSLGVWVRVNSQTACTEDPKGLARNHDGHSLQDAHMFQQHLDNQERMHPAFSIQGQNWSSGLLLLVLISGRVSCTLESCV